MRLTLYGYITLFIIIIAATVVLYLPIFFILKKKGKGFIRQSSYLLCFWSFIIIIYATIILFGFPIEFNPERYILNLRPLKWLLEGHIKQRIITEIRPNIMIFIPFGFFTPIAFKQMRKLYMTALAAFIVTLSVESFQYFIGRSSDVDDLIANLLGGIIGYLVYKIFSYILRNSSLWIKFTETYSNEKK